MYIDVNEFQHCSCDSEMLQAALDTAKETGTAVLVPKYNKRTGKAIWEIDRTVWVHSESILLLQNCHLRLADGCICNMFSNHAEGGRTQNVTIRGIGGVILDGGNHNGLYEVNGISRTVSRYPEHSAQENCMIRFKDMDNLVIENLTIRNQRYWAIALHHTAYSRVSNIHFSSDSNVPNQDGVDLLKGCHDIIIEKITGCVGDNIVALLATDSPLYENPKGDIYNITIRDIVAYGVGGCALIRLLNHDGNKIYNVHIDNVMEASPWSETDACVAQNPDLIITSNDAGEIIQTRHLIPGENGYRCEAAIIIGESYWYSKTKAQPGDTYGISVSNVSTHARYAIWVNNTLQDSFFNNIRLFGNGFMAAYFGEGNMENVCFSNIRYDKDCRPHPEDRHIRIDWNATKSDGLSCFYFNGTHVENISFQDVVCGAGMDSVFAGEGTGNVLCKNISHRQIPLFSQVNGICVSE